MSETRERAALEVGTMEHEGLIWWCEIEKLADGGIVGLRLTEESAAALVAYMDHVRPTPASDGTRLCIGGCGRPASDQCSSCIEEDIEGAALIEAIEHPASDGGEVRERAWTLARELAEVFASATGGNYEPDTLMHRAGSWAAEEIERALLTGTPQVDDAPPSATLYRRRCGWCGAYEGAVDPKEPCAKDETGFIGPHQFGPLEAVRGTPQVEREVPIWGGKAWSLIRRTLDKARDATGGYEEVSAKLDYLARRCAEDVAALRSAPSGEGEAKVNAEALAAFREWQQEQHDPLTTMLEAFAGGYRAGANRYYPGPESVPAREGEEDEVEDALGRVLYSLQPEFRHTRKNAVEHANEVLNRRTMQRAARLRGEGGGDV